MYCFKSYIHKETKTRGEWIHLRHFQSFLHISPFETDGRVQLSAVSQISAEQNKMQRVGVTQCLPPPFSICMPLTAMSLMTCSSWPCLGSLAPTGGARGPWSWSTCLFWEVIWSRTLCLPNPASLLILLSTAFNREPLQFTRVTPSKAVIRTPTPD